MEEKTELLVSDLASAFEPKKCISEIGVKDKWRSVSYVGNDFSGKMLSAFNEACPDDIKLNPGLKGYYKIYITVPSVIKTTIYIKLSRDEAFFKLKNHNDGLRGIRHAECCMEEWLWRCADMTGQEITITRKNNGLDEHTAISAIRFVPLTDEEVNEFLADNARQDTKTLYVTDDMNNKYVTENLHSLEDFALAILPYENSDVEWFSPEEIRPISAGACPVPIEDFAVLTKGFNNFEKQYHKFDDDEVLKYVTDKAHEKGIKVAVATRMGPWGMNYPYDQSYFDNPFLDENSDLCCVDRNGDEVTALSYAYPKVRKYFVDLLVNAARSGADAVTLISHRGVPYVLFEKPVADKFYELYNEYPYELPLDDPRVNNVHCYFMTLLFKELREALDSEFGKNKVQIHLRSQLSIVDAKYLGFDVESLAEKKLIDVVVSYPMRFHEILSDDVFKDDTRTRIDLDRYSEYVKTAEHTTFHCAELEPIVPYKNSRGELVGPASAKERIEEWNVFEEKYGVKVYFEIFPRFMPNGELKKRALEMYDFGAKRFALWDAFDRAQDITMWNLAKKLGHAKELKDMEPYGDFYKRYRVLKYDKYRINRFKPQWGG